MGVRAPATITDSLSHAASLAAAANSRELTLRSGGQRLLDDLEDVVADQLVALDQRVAERRVHVAVLLEHRA